MASLKGSNRELTGGNLSAMNDLEVLKIQCHSNKS